MMKRAPLVYVAGPYNPTAEQERMIDRGSGTESDYILRNTQDAEVHGQLIASLDLVPIVPHRLFSFAASYQPEPFWYDATREVMKRCEAVYFMPNWKQSLGAQMEMEDARRLKMAILRSADEARVFSRRWYSGDFSIPGDLAVPGSLFESDEMRHDG